MSKYYSITRSPTGLIAGGMGKIYLEGQHAEKREIVLSNYNIVLDIKAAGNFVAAYQWIYPPQVGQITLIELNDEGEMIDLIEFQTFQRFDHERFFSFSPDARFFAFGDGGAVVVFDLAKFEVVGDFPVEGFPVVAVCFDADGTILYSNERGVFRLSLMSGESSLVDEIKRVTNIIAPDLYVVNSGYRHSIVHNGVEFCIPENNLRNDIVSVEIVDDNLICLDEDGRGEVFDIPSKRRFQEFRMKAEDYSSKDFRVIRKSDDEVFLMFPNHIFSMKVEDLRGIINEKE